MPPHPEESALAVTRRKRVSRPNEASLTLERNRQSQNPSSERSGACVDNYDDIEACREPSFSENPVVRKTVRAVCRSWETVRGARLSYKQARRLRNAGTSLIILLMLYFLTTRYVVLFPRPPTPHRPSSLKHLEDMPIVLKAYDCSTVTNDLGGWLHPSAPFPSFLTMQRLSPPKRADYGGIDFRSAQERHIQTKDDSIYEAERSEAMEEMDSSDSEIWHEEEQEFDERECRTPLWAYDYYPNCNMFHEVDLARSFDPNETPMQGDGDYNSHEFSHGDYRDAWLVETRAKESWVLKTVRYKHSFKAKYLDIVQADAVVMEKPTAAPNIVNMYGHCARSVNVEAMDDGLEEYIVPGEGMINQTDLNDSEDVDVKNTQNNTEKLQLAIEMAESIAQLHGYEGGVIVHDDVQLCQWMRSKDGKLKLGDFNRAQILEWNDEKQEYCKFVMWGAGNYRAPEEFAQADCDEKIDVFSMGNNIYALLTGLWVFYEIDDYDAVQKKVIDGELPFVDHRYRTRSFAEGKLVEIMERCWKYDPADRVDIFEVVQLLRNALKEHLRLESLP